MSSFADFGCMLEIMHLDYLPDGRSLVETIGRRRFRVLQWGQLDGYHKAEIEYLSDKKVEGEELEELQRLHDMVYQQLEECFSQQRQSLPRRIFLMHHTSPPPKEDNIQVSVQDKITFGYSDYNNASTTEMSNSGFSWFGDFRILCINPIKYLHIINFDFDLTLMISSVF